MRTGDSLPQLEIIMSKAKDLTQEPPRSPRIRIGGYALLARMADKGRAELARTHGSYHFGCPLDEMLFEFKGVTADAVKAQLQAGLDDRQLAEWFDSNGITRTEQEKEDWSDEVESYRPYESPDKKEWFLEECEPLGLDPAESTLFEYLETDDQVTFEKGGMPKASS
jgi:hypothetical protein